MYINVLNQLTQCGETTFRYDSDGNLIEKRSGDKTTTYQYDALNRLIAVDSPDHGLVRYTYDAFNHRLTKEMTSGTYRFFYDEENEIGMVDEQGNIIEMRVLGIGLAADIGAAVAIEQQGRVYAPIHDHRGSVRCLVDVNEKKAVEYYRYTAFGEETIFNGQGEELKASEAEDSLAFFKQES